MELQELKEFIIWAKQNKLKKFKKGNIEFELSDLAFLESASLMQGEEQEISSNSSKTLCDTEEMSKEEYEDLLYWSSQKNLK